MNNRPVPCRLLIVGEAWGSEEARRSLQRGAPSPFVGKSGWFLRLSLAAAGVLPQPSTAHYPGILGMEKEWDQAEALGIRVTNVFQCRPGERSDDLEQLCGFHKGGKQGNEDLVTEKPPLRPSYYLKREHEHHLQALEEEVQALQPNLLLLLGGTALWAFTNSTGIGKARGAIIAPQKKIPKILPTYHPKKVLKRWYLRPSLLADLLKASREMESPLFERKERTIWYAPENPQELWDWWAEYATDASLLSVDIETEANRWISEVGISLGETKCLHVPILQKIRSGYPELISGATTGEERKALIARACAKIPKGNKHQLISYWETPEEETQVWLFLKHVLEQVGLKSPVPMVGQNFLYDIQYLLRAAPVPGGIRVRGFSDDTMLMQHALYPGLEKSLGFMASVECNEPGWKDLRKKGGKEENE